MDRFKAINIFVEVADKGSFSAAAESLGIVNSVVSKNIRQLEDWLGRKLVYRSTRHMRLTRDGLTYLAECRALLERMRHLESLSRTDEPEMHGQVRITAPVYIGQKLLVPVLAAFRKRHSGIGVDLLLADRHVNLVAEGIDIALRVSQMSDSDLVCRRLTNMTLKLVASPDYLEMAGEPESLADLPRHECLLEGEDVEQVRWRFAGPHGRRISVPVRGAVKASHGEAIKAFSRAGLGIAQLPHFFVDDEILQGELAELLPQHALDDFHIHLLYHREATRNPATARLVEVIRASF